MKKDNRMVQMAFEYALYMMASSYFEEKPICRSEWMEGKLYFHYQMTKEKEQYQLEDACIRYLEQELWDFVPKELWLASGIEAKLTRRHGAKYTELLFRNQDIALQLMGRYDISTHKAEFKHCVSYRESFSLKEPPKEGLSMEAQKG